MYEDKMLIQGEFNDFHYMADTSRQQFRGLGITLRADGVSNLFRAFTYAYTIPNDPNSFFRFFPVGDDLFVQKTSSGVLFLVTELTEDNIRLQAVDTPLLDSRTITDMANFLGDTYITTLSGTFRQEAVSLRSSRRE